jgi:hypothetical protein
MKVFISDAVEKLHRKSSIYFKSYIYNGVFWELAFIIHIGESSHYDVNMCKKRSTKNRGEIDNGELMTSNINPFKEVCRFSNRLKTSATAINLHHTFL